MKNFIVSSLFILLFASNIDAQIYPVTLAERVQKSTTIAIVTVDSKQSYWDQHLKNIYTLNVLQVTAFLKGHSNENEIAMITEGGQIEGEAQVSHPETKLREKKSYVVFLMPDNNEIDYKNFRLNNPNTIQCLATARVQGAMLLQDGKYLDALVEAPQTEEELLDKIQNIIGEKAKRPDGKTYIVQAFSPQQDLINRDAFIITSVEDGSGTMAPGPFVAGTIVTANELIIKASAGGFGSPRGTGKVEFDNADDPGGSTVEPPNASDYVSWSDTEIRVKIPADAGTGDVKVTDGAGFTDTYSSITIKWAINPVDSDFYLWSADNRNRVELVEDNGAGGYTLEYSTVGGMASNTDAQAAFERALTTWRCATFVNFDISPTSTGVGLADDDINVVMFASLSGSTLGVATSRYAANGTGSCDLEDTFWRLKELDIRFDDSGTTWYYGSGACPGGSFDFESVALHELGHGHGLGHIDDATKVMNPSISSCAIMQTLSADEIAAGDHKMDHSETANCLGPPTYPDVITPVPSGDCVLPVEIISFHGNKQDRQVALHWHTGTEINNDYFTLERSLDGRNFRSIAVIQGAGTSAENQFYKYIDEKPELGVNYYRLAQTDFDGSKEIHSKIIAVDFLSETASFIRPHPVPSDQFQLVYHAQKNGVLQIEIYDMASALIFKKECPVQEELNYIDLSIPDLSAGIYFIKTNNKNTQRVLKFIKTSM